MYNDNGSLPYNINGISIPYPVDQAVTINPFSLVNVFVNYTVKDTSFLRGSKIQLAINNLADIATNITGITPFVAGRRPQSPYVAESVGSAEFAAGPQRYADGHRRLGSAAKVRTGRSKPGPAAVAAVLQKNGARARQRAPALAPFCI